MKPPSPTMLKPAEAQLALLASLQTAAIKRLQIKSDALRLKRQQAEIERLQNKR